MFADRYPCYVGGEARFFDRQLPVTNKYTQEVFTRVSLAGEGVVDEAIALARQASEPMRRLACYERQAVLDHCVARFRERAEELALSLCLEAGKPIRDARGEVARLIDTFRLASEESTRIYGEVMPLDISPRARGYTGFWKRVAIGPCSFISPFNFPLNLVAHKVAAALAVGCPFVLKPASFTPLGALLIGEILTETSLPKGAFSILPCSRSAADAFTTDERLKLLSFTGSPEVGWDLKARAGKKKVVLELGGNAAVVVDQGVDLDDVVQRILVGAFYQSGQSCISVQRILIHEAIFEPLRDRLVQATLGLVMGDPREETTFIGPMITEKEAERLESWIQSAVRRGARVLCGGKRRGNMHEATLLSEVPKDENLVCKEAFGPVAVLSKFKDLDEAFREVNDSAYGLQAGVFTRDIFRAHQAWEELEVGGVVINDIPSWRVDHMPYGGVKDSGLGREGVRFAMQDMTEIRMLVMRTPG
ncbi:MAG TPA: aldehyde dehydrogenase family protein [Polyangiaceae bacterium]|nr:MAG: Sulfoacetaldehyde dehydrogenase [Deltaproteobacteria bacterium ADurb.Bin207]HOT12990.1 aldehyde dehydrogenase family protein [Polyangiaceae bacterium]HQF22777.1 aldehyde dehydrogenase family protein [Polyangiaceae bacterium]HQM10440.1 aldehyde dehydrogenase family protein [Polyangiaceae bacterium]